MSRHAKEGSKKQRSKREDDTSAGSSGRSIDRSLVEALKHIDTFYEAPPPGLIKEQEEERPEDAIPDLPQNRDARDFLAKAPSKGLWMPLGKEVKVMQCWKCKSYGHRSGDKECPNFYSGKKNNEEFRYMHEDPMHGFMQDRKREKKDERIKQLQALLESDSDEKEPDKATSKRKKRSESFRHDPGSPQPERVKEKRHKKRRSRSRSAARK